MDRINVLWIKIFNILVFMLFSISVHADNLRIAVGLALPPYVLKTTNNGIEVDIAREALALKGHSIDLVYLPFARVPSSLADKAVDAALTLNENSGLSNISYSDSHITYQNVAISLAENKHTINQISDLTPLSVIAFQNATKYLGSDFSTMAKKNGRYKEKAQQSAQITMLFAGRTDAVVMDINIYKYFKAEEKKFDTSKTEVIHEIFSPSHYKIGFLNSAIRDDFNAGLKELKASGRYEEIIKHYVNE